MAKKAAQYLPAISLLPLLATPLPTIDNHAREVAGYFQSLAFVQTGLASYTFLTPDESYSALHLHSLLSSPFVALGYEQGGRLVTLTAALVAAVLVSRLAGRLWGRQEALLAPALLWATPQFMRFSARYWPDTLSIALTTACVLALLSYLDTDDNRYYWLAAAILAVAITNHMWEATIALPLVALLLHTDRREQAAGIAVVAAGTVGLVWTITSLQPSGASTLTKYGIQTNPTLLLSPHWWLHGSSIHPLRIAVTLTVPAALIALVWSGLRSIKTDDKKWLLLTTWFVSGLSIPILLAAGYHHWYYSWALLVPLALAGAYLGSALLDRLARAGSVSSDEVIHVVVIVLVCSSLLYGVVFEIGGLAGTQTPVLGNLTSPTDADVQSMGGIDIADGEAKAAGQQLRHYDIQAPSEVVFVGNWGIETSRVYYQRPALTRVLIYGHVLPRERGIGQHHGP